MSAANTNQGKSRWTYVAGMLPSSTKRSSMARPMPRAPATASSPMDCQADGLKRSGRLRTGALRLESGERGRAASAQHTHLKAVRLPRLAVERVARIQHAPLSDERRDEIEVQVLESAMV